MPQDNRKGSPGFFSVLLGRGPADLKGETQAGDEKRPFNDGRSAAAAHNSRLSGVSRPYEQPRSSFAVDSRAPLRTSMSQDTSRSTAHRDSAAFRPEQAARRQPETLPLQSKTDARPAVPAMRSHRDQRYVDVHEAHDPRDKSEVSAPNRSLRKVAFNTPTHSLRKGKAGFPRLDEAGSSSDSSYPPPARKPVFMSAKPKHTRTTSKTEFEERNWNSSTATLQDKEPSRSRSTKKSRPIQRGSYPLTQTSHLDGFQAVRVSGPDRVIIVPAATAATTAMEAEPQADRQYLPVASTGSQKRRRPVQNQPMQPPPMSKRSSQDASRTTTRSADVQRSRSSRDRQTISRSDGDARADREPSESRTLTSIRPMPPMPDLPATTLLSQNMARARAGQRNAISSYHTAPNGLQHATPTMPQVHDRPANARTRAQRAWDPHRL
ncbi:uncharacterized protein SPSC_01441 [Sporisorium scitamineum]|uniref:Uncharacterized protein n=1 Tax=Sporisorium scitamineum TaxID=49012 RepID=A0A0F7SCU1_9BASI|nr:uncharacterized protein SPSC_01441 [Sporisorium scitamineum]CDW98713.1 hypothetical protein [Sporisorium scitamineum]